ncbi:MAG: Flp pilus assembly complex ATPase component TadA [Desulfobulbaceae bacterium]|uniref:Flp pilus assembly complex ATPase component TadA n=1 Tax=Candidatus Desulfobia pelagia TaxID=2841692 RepID=A0A8J6NDC1_9BACT|nr:Flp pilus assembly complex ATPase component TadA [Candidatus Desulfobia pelagia]
MTKPPKKKRFGDILIDGGLITATQLQQALDYGKEREIKLGEALLSLGFVTELAVAKTLSKQLAIPYVDLNKVVVDPAISTAIPESMARQFKLIAIGTRPGEILVAFADPLNIFAIDEISRHLNDKLIPCVAVESLINAAIDRIYLAQTDLGKMAADTSDSGEESEAVGALNDILLGSVKEEASDIHIEPDGEKLRVRYRVDGLLRKSLEYPVEMHPSLVSRIKIVSQLDIGERRKPQDGRFDIPISGKEFDIRVSILPLSCGEKVVMRLLDKSKIQIGLRDLGFEKEQQDIFEKHLSQPHEIILVTGPTGSGKTTTLYAALNKINGIDKNIVTVEDPVEYELKGVNQVQVNPKADLTFVTALRSILRQDPDVVMIGEIRDVETAEIAIQSALTGHLVLSTLHTNDACGAVARLIDMGIPPFLIASSLGLVVAQRLLRCLCKHCKESFTPPEEVWQEFNIEYDKDKVLYKPVGCLHCEQTGYHGRTAIYETLSVSTTIGELIMARSSSHEIAKQARKEGFKGLRQAGIKKMLAGITSLDEVLRVSMDSQE